MGKKSIIWEFNQSESILFVSDKSREDEKEKEFWFKLTRYKNKETYEESLRIESFYKGAENGYIDTSICSLDNDLRKFKKYGVAFSGHVYTHLKQEIENIYLSLSHIELDYDENTPKMVDSIVMKDILEMIGEIIYLYEFKEECYHIPVEQFNLLIDESEYNKYDLESIKRWLFKNKFTKCGKGRLTNLTRLKKGEKPTRVISFYASKISPYQNDENIVNESKQKDA